jgi:hypothetical protein
MSTNIKEVILYDADTLEYTGKILVEGGNWQFSEVSNDFLLKFTKGMPLKAVLQCLISFNIVYDIIEI